VGPDAAGWRLRLVRAPGEKVLAPAFTLGHTTFFTSFAPAAATDCGLPRGSTHLYALTVRDGAPAIRSEEAAGEDAPGEPALSVPLVETGAPLTTLQRLHAEAGLLICAAAHCVAPE